MDFKVGDIVVVTNPKLTPTWVSLLRDSGERLTVTRIERTEVYVKREFGETPEVPHDDFFLYESEISHADKSRKKTKVLKSWSMK